jgi:hypothetical protein
VLYDTMSRMAQELLTQGVSCRTVKKEMFLICRPTLHALGNTVRHQFAVRHVKKVLFSVNRPLKGYLHSSTFLSYLTCRNKTPYAWGDRRSPINVLSHVTLSLSFGNQYVKPVELPSWCYKRMYCNQCTFSPENVEQK